MEHSDKNQMTPFDRLIASEQLRMMKLLIPYVPPEHQRMLAIYTKFLELEHTIHFFRRSGADIHAQAFEKEITSPADIIEELRPYLSEQQQAVTDSVMNIMNIINMMEMASAMGQMTSDEDGHSDAGTWNPMDLMKEMLTPQQQSMFEIYNTMFQEAGTAGADDEKGDSEYGTLVKPPGPEKH